jgi:hypothetical protein
MIRNRYYRIHLFHAVNPDLSYCGAHTTYRFARLNPRSFQGAKMGRKSELEKILN